MTLRIQQLALNIMCTYVMSLGQWTTKIVKCSTKMHVFCNIYLTTNPYIFCPEGWGEFPILSPPMGAHV